MLHEAGVDRAVIVPPHPQLAMTADHLGVTGDIVKEGKLTEGVKETAALAKYSNVSVKLSTTPFYSSESYPFRDMAEHIRRLSMPMGRAGAIGQPTSRIPSTRRRTGNASRISPRRWIFSRTKTKSGSWAALSWRD
jgi:hypothetical protein